MAIAQENEHFYLSGRHFSGMLVLACLLHMIFIMIYLLVPKDEVEKVPVHVLNIKLGSGDIRSFGSGGGSGGETLAPRIVSSVELPAAVKAVPAQPRSAVKTPPKAPTPAPEPVQKTQPQEAPPQQQQQQQQQQAANAVATPYENHSRPSQYVRADQQGGDGGQGIGNAGSRYGNSTSPEAEVMHRYTQLISMWVNRHKQLFTQGLQPGMKGNIIVRLQIDRAGNILYFKLDKGTGVPAADAAAGKMVRAANPVPPVPMNYPGGNLFEFLISVGYTAQ